MVLKKFYVRLADLSQHEADLLCTHSIDEASDNHQEKMKRVKRPVPQQAKTAAT